MSARGTGAPAYRSRGSRGLLSARGSALAGLGGFLGRGRSLRGGTRGRSFTAELAAFMRRRVPGMSAAARPRFLAAAVILVDGRPGAPLGFLLRNATLLVALGDMVGLAFLLVGVFGFV